MGRDGYAGLAADSALEDGVNVFQFHRPGSDFEDRPHHDPHHVVEEAFPCERKVQQIAFLLDCDVIDGPDRRFFRFLE